MILYFPAGTVHTFKPLVSWLILIMMVLIFMGVLNEYVNVPFGYTFSYSGWRIKSETGSAPRPAQGHATVQRLAHDVAG